jgi:methionyl aminopeptidase
MVPVVETFVSNGTELVKEAAVDWRLLLPKHHYSAQFEHTIVVTKGKSLILTEV